MSHRPSRETTRGALAGAPLASGEKLATVGQVMEAHNTSCAPGKIAGDNIKDISLRIGTVNVGSMRGRDGEVADMAARRRLDIC